MKVSKPKVTCMSLKVAKKHAHYRLFHFCAGEAASVWRAEKLRDFLWRARCLGIEAEPTVRELLARLQAETTTIDAIWQQQQESGYQRKWWQDGEYDAHRADVANDDGMQAFTAGDYSKAFECFTESIRLCPTSAVYHCNRAAAALKLNRSDIAAEDAENAVARDDCYVKALLRAGRARLALKEPDPAKQHFKRVQDIEPNNIAAAKGLKDAEAMAQTRKREDMLGRQYAEAGGRPALPRTAVAEEEAAMQLLSVDSMIPHSQNLESLRCAKVEALIQCRRYQDAVAACEALRPGWERVYLLAEVLWRQGEVDAAVNWLESEISKVVKGDSPHIPRKCAELLEYLIPLRSRLKEASDALHDGTYLDVVEQCDTLLETLECGACSGLYCLVLRQKADASAARGQYAAAKAGLDRALEVQADDADTLRLRADVHKQMGAYVDYFLDIQRLKQVAPGDAGIAVLLEDAANMCLESGVGSAESGQKILPCGTGPASAYAALQVKRTASVAEIRKAYLSLASKFHPDKWVAAGEDERALAEERFKAIQAAYDTLTAV
jgi:DnaJ homolog subfamily C member 7